MKVYSGRKRFSTSLSIEPKLINAAKRKAKKNRRSFSAHVQLLIERDLEEEAGKKAA